MGICVSKNRSALSISDDEISPQSRGRSLDRSEGRSSRSSASKSGVLSGLQPRSPERPERSEQPAEPERDFPFAAAPALVSHMDAVTLARFAATNPLLRGYLPDARQRLEATNASITAEVEQEIHAFANPDLIDRSLDITSPALRRIAELPTDLRAALLDRALAGYELPNAVGIESIEAPRARFALLCEQVVAEHASPHFPRLADQLVMHALMKTYSTGDAQPLLNTDEPLRQVLPVFEHLPANDRHRLAEYMRLNVVFMVRAQDRDSASHALRLAAGANTRRSFRLRAG
jgi:hypothetical protein